MIVQRNKEEIIIKLPSSIDFKGIENVLRYLSYRETLSKSKASKAQIEQLSEELMQNWWSENRI